MLHTSIIVELLRSQPRLTFWLAALIQTILWWVFPSLFFSSPPGDLPIVLAVGHEFQLGSYFGPPLAFWLADIAFVVGGTRRSTSWRRPACWSPIGRCSRWGAPSSAFITLPSR